MFTAFKISHSFHSLKNFLTIFLSIYLHCTAQVNSPRVYSLYCLRYVLRIQSSCEEIRPLCPAFQKTPIKCLAGSAFSVLEKNQICTASCRRIKIFFLLNRKCFHHRMVCQTFQLLYICLIFLPVKLSNLNGSFI